MVIRADANTSIRLRQTQRLVLLQTNILHYRGWHIQYPHPRYGHHCAIMGVRFLSRMDIYLPTDARCILDLFRKRSCPLCWYGHASQCVCNLGFLNRRFDFDTTHPTRTPYSLVGKKTLFEANEPIDLKIEYVSGSKNRVGWNLHARHPVSIKLTGLKFKSTNST